MCVLQWLLKWQAENQAGRACVLSGFLSIRLNDQNEQRVWRVCSRWVFVVAVYATDLSCLFKITVMVFVKGVKKNLCCAGWELLSLHSPSCGPRLENLFLIAACPCDLVSVACLLPWIVKRGISASVSAEEGSWTSHTRTHSATASQPAIWSGDQPSVAWEIHT